MQKLTPVEMPKANENLAEATLDRWLVKEGQSVKTDAPLCDIITDKAKFELPSPGDGVILKLIAPERALLPVGYILCVIGEAGAAVPEEYATRNEELLKNHRAVMTGCAAAPIQSSATESATPAAAQVTPALAGSGVRATPAARRVAKELGVDLAAVAAKYNLTAPVGEKDVKRFADEA